MITIHELAAGLYGAWRLAHFDRSGVAWFDGTARGAKRSFHAMAVVAPAYVVLLGLNLTVHPVGAGELRIIAVYAIAYIIDWTAFPLIMSFISETVGAGANYLRYVSALNWARVIESVVFLPAAALTAMAPGGLLDLIPLAIFAAVLVYHWFVARAALDIKPIHAVMVVVTNLVVSVMINMWARTLVV